MNRALLLEEEEEESWSVFHFNNVLLLLRFRAELQGSLNAWWGESVIPPTLCFPDTKDRHDTT